MARDPSPGPLMPKDEWKELADQACNFMHLALLHQERREGRAESGLELQGAK